MQEPDARAIQVTERPRRYSTNKVLMLDPNDIEKITIAPSTELIPDEYEHEDNKNGLVLIFYSESDKENMLMLKQALSDQNYDVSDDNLYKMSTKEFVMDTLKRIARKDHEDKTCFILAFMGNAEREDQFLPDKETDKKNCISIRDVWSLFTSDSCPTFKNKPKIFIFQASKKLQPVQFDSRAIKEEPPKGAYDIPAEADILLVYKKIDVPWARSHFIEQLSNNFHDYGHRDDMVGLVTHTDHAGEKRPLIISTLTRKFYIRSSDQRGHHQDIHENHDAVVILLQDLNEKIKEIQEQQSVFKRKLEQRVFKKWQDTSTATSATGSPSDDSTVKSKESAKTGTGGSTKTSRPTSSASSVDSNMKKSKADKKSKAPWRY